MVQRKGVACRVLLISVICWIFCTVSVKFVYGKINVAGINFTCHPPVKDFDITFGGASFSCDNDNFAQSFCKLNCSESSFLPALTIYQMITCQVYWDGKSKELTPARWYGRVPWCAPYLCELPDVLGYGSGYTCDQPTFSNEAGTFTGYKLGTKCTFPCPASPGIGNILECYDKEEYTAENVPFWFGKDYVLPAAWRFIETPCEPAPCPSIWTLVEGSSPGLSCSNDNKLISLCVFMCRHLGKVPSRFDGTRCVMGENGVSEWNRPPATCLDEPRCVMLYVVESENRNWNCSNANYIDSLCERHCGLYKTHKGSKLARCTKLPNGTAVWRNLEEGYEDNEMATCVPLLCGDPLYDFPYGELVTCTLNPRNAIFSTCYMKCPEHSYAHHDTPIRISCIPDAGAEVFGSVLFVVDSDPCLMIECQEVKAALYGDPHLDTNCTGVHYHDQCFFGCKTEGYQLNTDIRWMTCVSHYTWYPPLYYQCIPEIPPPNPEIGRIPIFRENFLDKRYLIFEDLLGWVDSLKYCEARWGTLAMPKNLEIHQYLVDKIQTLNINKNDSGLFVTGVWMGMSDQEEEGVWKFVNGDPVNMGPDFGDMTNGNTIPKFQRNATLGDYWWFIWAQNHFCTYEECKQQCANMGGTLANIISQEINDAVGKQVIDEFNFWKTLGDTLESGQEAGNYFINIKGSETDQTVFIQGDGQRVYIFDQWYTDKWLQIPLNREDFAPYQNWQTWTDPQGFELGQHCVAIIENGYWIDQDCNMNLPLLCEKGPYSFERWLGRGTSSSEPNNNWSVEHCGGFITELDTPMWNDFDCLREFPFICEVDVECPWIDRNSLSPQTNFTCEWSSEGKPQCEFTCKKGYWLDTGIPTTTCVDPDGDRVGEWKPVIPNCVLNEMFCSGTVFESSPYLKANCSIGNAYNSTCDLSCPPTMKLNKGVTSVTCEDKDDDDNGEWSDEIPGCEAISCPTIDESTLVPGTTFSCTDAAFLNSVCTFSCSSTMKVGSVDTTTCVDADNDGVGDWDNPFPACLNITCPLLDTEKTTAVCSQSNIIESTCTLSCKEGEWLDNGDKTQIVTCEDSDADGMGDWSANPSSCVGITCPKILPWGLTSGTSYICPEILSYGSVCDFSCPSTKTLESGINSIRCDDSNDDGVGEWSEEIPYCVDILCPELANLISNDTVRSCVDSNVVFSVCTLSCPVGKRLNNGEASSKVTCVDNDRDNVGEWDKEPPSCGEIACPDIDTSTIDPNTEFSCTSSKSFGSVCTFSCPATMKPDSGLDSITCEDSDNNGIGEWDNAIPNCINITCPQMTSLVSSNVSFDCTNGNIKLSSCVLTCSEGQWLESGDKTQTVTCEDKDNDGVGDWSENTSECADIACPDITGLPSGAHHSCDKGNLHGSTCSFNCDATMKLGSNTSKINCLDPNDDGTGEWNAPAPSCVDIVCPPMAELVSNDTLKSCTSGDVINSICTLSCKAGKRLSNGEASFDVKCTDDDGDGEGNWNASLPACGVITCPDTGEWSLSTGTYFTCTSENNFGTVCTFSCSQKKKLDNKDENSVMCADSDGDGIGDWNTTTPNCTDILCLTLDSFVTADTVVRCSGGNMIDSVCSLSCGEGMTLADDGGSNAAVCEDINGDKVGEWNTTVSNCTDIVCPLTSELVSNDTLTTCTNDNLIDSTCTLSCEVGKRLGNGEFSFDVKCLDDDGDGKGLWNVSLPSCGVITCPSTTKWSPSNGTSFTCTDDSKFGSLCTFTCSQKHKFENAEENIISCGDSNDDGIGDWNTTAPNCTDVLCTMLDSLVSNDTAVNCIGGNAIDSVCSMSCGEGLTLADDGGSSVVVCEDPKGDKIGRWNDTVSNCTAITCPVVDPATLSLETSFNCSDEGLFGSRCSFSCPDGMKLDNSNSILTCEDSNGDGVGEWNATVPECIDITCETINASVVSPFSIVNCTDGNVINSECTFSCGEGKKLTNDFDTVKCVDVDANGFGEWNSTFTDCADITCPNTAKWSLSNGSSFTCTNGSRFDSVCTFTCSRKHKFVNEDEGNLVSCRDSDEDGIGDWNATPPNCTDVLCTMLDSLVSNDTVVSCTDGNIIDSICSISCGEGLTLADDGGSNMAVCEDINGVKVGEWNATASNCTAITCPVVDPATLSLETSFNCSDESLFGSNCSFSCPDGMKLNNSNSILTCKDSNGDGVGEWNGTIPECIDITCETINASAVSRFSIVNCTSGNVMNSECTFSCTEGKKIESDVDTVRCIDVDTDGFGEWNSTFPGCAEIVCPHLTSRNFSSSTIFNCTNSFGDGEQSYGAMCTFKCSEGSILESKLVEETILCQDDDNDFQGDWNGTLPDCSAVYCEEVDSDSLGKTTVRCNHTNNLHSECMFECPDGMQVPNAISTINCKDPDYDGVGNWTDSIPVCYDVECDDITRSMVNDETFFTCSHWKCSFYCNDGTTLVGDSDVLTCSDPYGNKTGRWSHDIPICLPINCTELNSTLLSPETSISCTNSHHVGSECTFTCPKGMAFQTESNIMKCEDLDDNGVGEWDTDIMPNCTQIFCSVVDWKVIPKKLNVNCSDTNYWGSECQFTCPEGEWTEGGITDMKCRDTDKDGNGEWSETMPNCERIQCFPEYSFLQDGSVNCTDLNFYNSTCNFTCDYSYRLIGFNPAMCTDLDNDGNGEWNESFPFCEEYEIIIPSDCPEYSDPANGYMSCTDNGYIGSVCTYYCNEGYVLFGPEDLECLEIDEDTAEWSDVYPICSTYLGECSPPYGNPLHGSVSCTGKHYVTSVCTFTCKEEYHVVGSEVVTCDDNDYDKVGDWSDPEPICFPDVVKCKTKLESPESGQLSCTNENIKDSVCNYDCDVGYYVAGSSKLTCTDDNNDGIGKWDNLTPTCETITCEEILPGSLTAETNYSCTNGNIGNSECSFSCPEKFRLSNGVSTIYCEDVNESSEGEWSDDIPECLPVTCEFDPDDLDETTVYDCTKLNHLDSVCNFHCPSGMKLTTSHNQTTCQDLDEDGLGDWDKEVPDCTPILCTELDPETMSPQTSYSCSKLNHGNSECIFKCPVGWKLDNGVEMIVCEDKDGDGDGEWSDDTPSCIPITCPEIDNDDLSPQTSFHCSDGNLGNSICQFSCPEDMRLDRDIDKVTCVDKNGDGEGEWSDKIPYCVFTCRPDLKAPDKGKYSCSDLNRAGSQCDYQCDSGFVLSHVNLVTCGINDAGTDGTWKGDAPTCDPFEYLCPELGTFYLSPETEYTCTKLNKRASRCTFSCPAEMELDTGRTVIDCEDKNRDGIGEWSAKPPECIRTACSTASTKVKYGESICTKSHFIGSSCAFECKAGFQPQPPHNIICQENGLWNSSAPSCDATNCLPDLKEMFGPDANCLGGNEPGAECDVKCSHRSQKYGEKVTFVCANPDVNDGAGFWDKDLLSCAGCASGLLDLMFLLDSSANWEMWYFSDMRDWLSEALNRIRRGINEGATWVSVATFGSREKQCNLAYTVPKFKLELKLDFRNMEDVKRKLRAIKHMGGCAHLGRGLNEALNHLEARHRPHVTPMIVLLLGGKSHDGVSNALTRVNNSDIPIFGVAYGKKAAKLLNDNWITHFNVTSAEDYKGITSPILDALVKYDCKDHSLCSGPIENGTVTCILKQEGHASELCTIHCDDGFQLVGRETALCGDLNGDGRMEWISPHGVCKNISCPAFRPIENTQMQCSNGNLFSSTCRFWCNKGLSLIGLSQVICGDPDGNGIGEWHTRPPRCIRGLACQPELLALRFGSVFCTRNNSFGSECRFSCEDGYTLRGSGLIVCRDAERNGQVMWDNPPPMCSEGCTSQFCGRDVIFLLDGSGSINREDFKFAKNWVVQVFEEFQGEIDTGGTWVGVIQYSGESSFICASGVLNPKYTVELELGRYPFRYVKETILQIAALRGCTATGDAIRQATKHFQALGREHIDKILILLTDGRSNDDVIEPAKQAELEGIKIIAVGIGSFNPDQLLAITGRFVSADNYGELANVLDEVQDEIMSDYIEGQYGGLGCGYETRPNLVIMCTYVALWSFWMYF